MSGIDFSECGDTTNLNLIDKEYKHYLTTGSLIEGSDAYKDFFDGRGLVLEQNTFCDLCKYDHNECYRDD